MAFAVGLEEELTSGRPESAAQLSLQPETGPISHEQLTLEIKGIYAGLVMVDTKCIDVDERQSISTQAVTPRLGRNVDEQWQNILALYRTLVHEFVELLMAFQHLSATRTLSRSTPGYTMPARMWRQDLYRFLEVLQHWLHKFAEEILSPVHVAYIMMTLFLGGLRRFRNIRTKYFGNIDRQAVQYSYILATFWTYLIFVLEAGLVLPTAFWTCTRLWIVGQDETESYVSAYPVDPSVGCLCSQFASCAVDDESEDDDTLTVAPPDRNRVWPASPPTRAGLIPSFLCLFASALSGPRSRVLHWTVLFASFSRLTLGMPAPTNGSAKDSTRLSAPTDILADLAVVVLVVVVLVIAHLLIALKVKPLHVWATLMACSAFGWWCIRIDINASLVLSSAVFALWLFSSYRYGRSAFEKLQAPSYIPLVIVATAITFDACLVGYMNAISPSQTDLLSFSLPSVSLVLYASAVGLSAYRQHHEHPERCRRESVLLPEPVP